MFREWKCGCIYSIQQGRVRICDTHKLATTAGDGGGMSGLRGGGSKFYPANGETVDNWNGR